MRCLYCGKPLPLLKKLTGGGEFCSDAHRHKYQEEYNKLALSRLLQAQSAPGETGVFPASGGTGLRQLAAPAPPLPGGQRALPPPSAPALAAAPPALPPPTAHHQDKPTSSHEVFRPTAQPAQPAPVAVPRPTPPPPDPKEAPFLVRQHAAIAPIAGATVLKDLALRFSESRPQVPTEDLIAIPFDWESAGSAIAASQEPDPPEASAWRHPIEVAPPGEPAAPALAAFPFELFAGKPLHPVLRDTRFDARFPQAIRPKIKLSADGGALRVVPGELRLSAVRDWELNLSAPSWQPEFATVGAPPTPVRSLPAAAVSVPKPVETSPKPSESKGNMEVFVDLSALGIFD